MAEHICENCGNVFNRYKISATRAANPQYCCTACFSMALETRAMGRFRDRLMSHIPVSGDEDCWEWQGRRNKNGYGEIDFRYPSDSRARPYLAHRVAYETMIGPIPNGLFVLHKMRAALEAALGENKHDRES